MGKVISVSEDSTSLQDIVVIILGGAERGGLI